LSGKEFQKDGAETANAQLAMSLLVGHCSTFLALQWGMFDRQLCAVLLVVWQVFCHPYPEHVHRTGWNSSYPHGTSGCTPHTYFNLHPKGLFWNRSFHRPDVFLSPNYSIKALKAYHRHTEGLSRNQTWWIMLQKMFQ